MSAKERTGELPYVSVFGANVAEPEGKLTIVNCWPPCGTKLLMGAAMSAPVSAVGLAKVRRPYVVALPMPKSYVGDPLLLKTPVNAITPLFGCNVPLFVKPLLAMVVVPVAVLLRKVPALLKACPEAQQCWYIS